LGKVVSQDEVILQRREWKRNGKRVVWVAGAFELLHPGHVRLLEQARAMGEILVAGIASDASVRGAAAARKRTAGSERARASGGEANAEGIERPITPGAERAEIVAALEAVDYVVEYDEAGSQRFLAMFAPDVHVKGGRRGADANAAREEAEAEAAGIRTVYVPLEPGYSTTGLLERIQQLHA
jgi:D-glycero-beta-D-manno-heptose 1-phosphate adenylyltransferase